MEAEPGGPCSGEPPPPAPQSAGSVPHSFLVSSNCSFSSAGSAPRPLTFRPPPAAKGATRRLLMETNSGSEAGDEMSSSRQFAQRLLRDPVVLAAWGMSLSARVCSNCFPGRPLGPRHAGQGCGRPACAQLSSAQTLMVGRSEHTATETGRRWGRRGKGGAWPGGGGAGQGMGEGGVGGAGRWAG